MNIELYESYINDKVCYDIIDNNMMVKEELTLKSVKEINGMILAYFQEFSHAVNAEILYKIKDNKKIFLLDLGIRNEI